MNRQTNTQTELRTVMKFDKVFHITEQQYLNIKRRYGGKNCKKKVLIENKKYAFCLIKLSVQSITVEL